MIVGIDPGMTKGIAALDLDGNLVDLYSKKDLGLDAVIKHIVSLGQVSVLATDVYPAPDFVLKLAAQLGSVVYVPKESASVLEKMSLTRGIKTEDMHQRDSLAAAFLALKSFSNKFRKIDSMDLSTDDRDLVKHLVINGMPITEAIRKLNEEPKKETKEEIPQAEARLPTPEEKRMRMLERQNHALRDRLSEIETELDGMRHSFSKLKREYETGLRKDSDLRGKELSIKTLKHNIFMLEKRVRELEGLKKAWNMLLSKEVYPIGFYPEQKRGLVFLNKRLWKEDLEALRSAEVVFAQDKTLLEHLREKGINASDSSLVKDFDGCLFISSKDLESLKEKLRSKSRVFSIEDLVSGYRKQRI